MIRNLFLFVALFLAIPSQAGFWNFVASPAAPLTNTLSLTAGYAKWTGANITAMDFAKTDAFSYGCWAKAAASGGTGDEYMMDKLDNQTPGGWYLYNNGTNALKAWCGLQDTSSNNMYRFSNASLNDGAWHFVACTNDGSNSIAGYKLWVDTAYPASTTSGTSLAGTLQAGKKFTIKALVNGAGYTGTFLGKLNNCFVYNKELSSAELTVLYNSGKAKDLSALANYSNNVGWWRLGNSASDTTSTLIDTKSGNNLTGVTATLGADAP